MAKTFYNILKEARPRQWIKNGLIFISVFFSGQLFNLPLMERTILAIIAFCAASSAIYFINDISDIEKDRLHPFKKNRPIASGKISKNLGFFVAAMLIIFSLLVSISLSVGFTAIIIFFILMHIAYSFYLKNVMLIDILTIATGFILRVLAGEFVTGYHINVWLLLTVISASLFLAVGKRRSELTLLSAWVGSVPAKTRSTLSHYSEKMLDVYIAMFANSTWITYALYSFLAPTSTIRNSIGHLFDDSTFSLIQERKWLTITIPFVIYGVMRYLQLIYEKNVGESPEKVLLSDGPLITVAAILGVLLFGIIYVIGK